MRLSIALEPGPCVPLGGSCAITNVYVARCASVRESHVCCVVDHALGAVAMKCASPRLVWITQS
jgi:hypothetical protein